MHTTKNPRYATFGDLETACDMGQEDRTKIKIWIDNDLTYAWSLDDVGELVECLCHLGLAEDCLATVLNWMGYNAEHV